MLRQKDCNLPGIQDWKQPVRRALQLLDSEGNKSAQEKNIMKATILRPCRSSTRNPDERGWWIAEGASRRILQVRQNHITYDKRFRRFSPLQIFCKCLSERTSAHRRKATYPGLCRSSIRNPGENMVMNCIKKQTGEPKLSRNLTCAVKAGHMYQKIPWL